MELCVSHYDIWQSLTSHTSRPAGGNFTVEIAVNRAFTTLSYDGQNTNVFGDGQAHEGLGEEPLSEQQCITEPNSTQPSFSGKM